MIGIDLADTAIDPNSGYFIKNYVKDYHQWQTRWPYFYTGGVIISLGESGNGLSVRINETEIIGGIEHSIVVVNAIFLDVCIRAFPFDGRIFEARSCNGMAHGMPWHVICLVFSTGSLARLAVESVYICNHARDFLVTHRPNLKPWV